MLHVKVDLIPGGHEAARQTLTDLYIGNDGTGDRQTGHYDVYTSDPRKQPYPRETRPGWIGRIEDFDRGQGRDALAAEALRLLLAERGAVA